MFPCLVVQDEPESGGGGDRKVEVRLRLVFLVVGGQDLNIVTSLGQKPKQQQWAGTQKPPTGNKRYATSLTFHLTTKSSQHDEIKLESLFQAPIRGVTISEDPSKFRRNFEENSRNQIL